MREDEIYIRVFVFSTTSSAAVNLTPLNFRQLQELMNKWTIELGEQEKMFIEEATKVNAWDRTLMANGDKVQHLLEMVFYLV